MMTSPVNGRFVLPDVVVTQFLLKPGDKVADFGAGSGYFIPALAKAVTPAGRVFACEIQQVLIEKLGSFARSQGLSNVDPLWCDIDAPGGIKIPDRTLDAGVLVNTLFQLENKAAAITEIGRTMRPGAMLYVIDWSDSFGGLGPSLSDIVSPEAAIALCEANGFLYEREYPAGGHHYGLAFRKL